MKRLDLRDRLTFVVTVGAALVLAALTAGFNLTLRASLDRDATQVLDARSSAALATVDFSNGAVAGVEVPDQGDVDVLVWVYSESTAVERPRAPTGVQSAADALTSAPRSVEDAAGDVRLLSEPVIKGGRRVGTVIVGLSLAPYERTASQAFVSSVVFAVAIFVLVLIAARLIIGGALRPVARMTAEAADWSEHDLDHRFHAGEPHDELTRLAATFDSLLDRLAASLRHEQRFSAEVSHELRTPLAAIVAEAELALRRTRDPDDYRQALQAIANRATQLQRILETLLAAERAELGGLGTAEASAVAERARAACAKPAADRGIELTFEEGVMPLRVGMDADIAERVLAPLVENACRYAASAVRVAIRSRGEAVEFVVTDDGPGVADGEAERIFEPGQRGSAGLAAEGNGSSTGAGLGLALARRLARAVDGEVLYSDAERAFVFQAPRG